ncbi:MAG: hypothetical protein ACI9XO_001442 [Paraglaciecola sp.]|jgi:hypothetical protein
MGLNVIDRNHDGKLEELQDALGWHLEKVEEINFEIASESWKDGDICDIFFTERGTLIFTSMEMYDACKIADRRTLSFVYSEISMAFQVQYYENGILKRSIMEVEGNRMMDEGKKLDIEEKSKNTADIICNKVEFFLGKDFWEIEEEEVATRFKLSQKRTEKVNKTKIAKLPTQRNTKKWWEFWK